MNHIHHLIQNYNRFVHLPWSNNIPGSQRVWFAIYPPSEERKLRAQIREFEYATIDANHKWLLVDITNEPAKLISSHKYRESYFLDPEAAGSMDEDIKDHIEKRINDELQSTEIDENTVVALIGTSSLFGFIHISSIISSIDDNIKGRFLVFFPGIYDRNLYRFMDARDGFNYMAVPITCDEEMII
jgi:hypothetical protein